MVLWLCFWPHRRRPPLLCEGLLMLVGSTGVATRFGVSVDERSAGESRPKACATAATLSGSASAALSDRPIPAAAGVEGEATSVTASSTDICAASFEAGAGGVSFSNGAGGGELAWAEEN